MRSGCGSSIRNCSSSRTSPSRNRSSSARSGSRGSDPGSTRRACGRPPTRFLADALHAEIDGAALIRDLGVAERKLVQIARALIDGKARLVVFDEPTAPLAAAEVEQLFRSIRRLRERGIAMIYVSHYIGEITEICDAVTVFRNGADVGVSGRSPPATRTRSSG